MPEAGEAFRDTPSGGLLPLLRPSRQLSPGPLPAVLCRLAPSGGPLPLPRPSGPPVPQSFPAPLLPGPLPVLRLFRLPCFRPLSYVPAVLPFPMADRNLPVRFLFPSSPHPPFLPPFRPRNANHHPKAVTGKASQKRGLRERHVGKGDSGKAVQSGRLRQGSSREDASGKNAADKSPQRRHRREDTSEKTPQERHRREDASAPSGKTPQRKRIGAPLRQGAAGEDTSEKTPQRRSLKGHLREKRCGQAASGKPSVRISPAHG